MLASVLQVGYALEFHFAKKSFKKSCKVRKVEGFSKRNEEDKINETINDSDYLHQ